MTTNKVKMSEIVFRTSVIAQHDNEDWSQSGWVAFVIDGIAYLARYGHSSCYDTFHHLIAQGPYVDENDEFEANVDWSGTPDELVLLANFNGDPDMPGRVAKPEDYDYDHLQEVYKQIIAWNEHVRVVNQ